MLKRSLIALALIPLFFAIAACSSSDKNSDSSTAGDSSAPAGQGDDTARDLQQVLDNYASVKSFRAKVDIAGPGSSSQQGDLEIVMPDKFHAKYTSGTNSIEMVLIGTDTYYKQGDSWAKQPANTNSKAFDASAMAATLQSLESGGATKGGTDTVNGKKCQIYTSAQEGPAGAEEVCVADKLPLRYVSQNGDIKTTLTFSDYNKDIDIKAPA